MAVQVILVLCPSCVPVKVGARQKYYLCNNEGAIIPVPSCSYVVRVHIITTLLLC